MKRWLIRQYVKLMKRLKFSKIQQAKDVDIGIKTSVLHPENISFGEHSAIHSGMLAAGAHSRIRIGSYCMLSYNVHIRTNSHFYRDKDIRIWDQGQFERDIVIEDDCWVGYGAQIMPGVTLGKGSVIGAGAIVTKSTEPYGVYVGVPARKISERTSGAQDAVKED